MTGTQVAPEMERLVSTGLRKAEEGLSQLLGLPVSIRVDVMTLEPVFDLERLAWAPEAEIVGVYIGYTGDLTGHCLLCFENDDAERMANRMIGAPSDSQELTDSALMEAGNIFVSWLVNGLADCGGWKIMVTPPALARDMLGALVNTILAVASGTSEELLAVCVKFSTEVDGISGTLMLMPDAESMRALSGAERSLV